MISKSWHNYQSRTLNDDIAVLLKKFVNEFHDYHTIVDLGCGAGNETVYMVKQGYDLVAIDRELNKNYILDRLKENEQQHVSFIQSDFASLNIPRCDVVMAFFSIPFCEKSYFDELWDNIYKAINEQGYFVGQLFGERDDFSKSNLVNTFSKETVLKYLGKYEIKYFEEIEFIRESDNKKWHYFDIIAKKSL